MKLKIVLFLWVISHFTYAQNEYDNTPAILGVGSDYKFSFNYMDQIWRLKDGRVLALGYFPCTHSEVLQNVVMRFNPDGSPDGSFRPISGLNGEIKELELLPDGKILICGSFSMFNNKRVYQMIRFYSNGTVDETFKPISLGNSEIEEMDFLSRGRIRIHGLFVDNSGRTFHRVSVINSNGSFLRDEKFK